MPGASASFATVPLIDAPSPVQELSSLRRALGGGPRLLVKRDDGIPFAFGGNKVRKMSLVAAAALSQGADTLITCGGVQSNHARVTAITAAKLGLRCILVANTPGGLRPDRLSGNALLNELAGAEVRYVVRAHGSRSGHGRRGSRVEAERRPTVRDPARRLDTARCRCVRISGRRVAHPDRSARFHRPLDFFGRDPGRTRGGMFSREARHERAWHQRGRLGGVPRERDPHAAHRSRGLSSASIQRDSTPRVSM